jgi:tetratricopeptide (TPR) repeat protein
MLNDRPVGAAYHALCAASLLLVCITLYSNSLNAPFTFDDGPNIVNNEFIRVTQLDVGSLLDAGFESRAPRPVAYISFALNHYFGEYDVRGYHWVNIFIHWLSGILVYWLALDLFQRQRALRGSVVARQHELADFLPALFAAGIFVAHPIQTNAVTYIVQRMSSMATLFYLLALVLYLCGRDRIGAKRASMWVGSSVCWLLALGSKQTAVTLPLIILLYEWYFLQNMSLAWVKRRLPIVAAVVLGLLCCAGLFLALTETAFEYKPRDFNSVERLLTQTRVLMRYLSLLALPLPSRLNLTHDVAVSHSFLDPISTLFSTLALLALFALSIRAARSQRLLSFCILWFFINLAIESSFVALELMFEHRLYLPMLAFSVLVADGVRTLLGRQGAWMAVASVAIVVALGWGTYERNKTWQDEITLWTDVVAKSPNNYRAYSNLGKAFKDSGDLEVAVAQLNRSIELNDNFFPPRSNLASIALERGDRQEAIRQLRGALGVKHDEPRMAPYLAKAHRAIAKLLAAEGEWAEAREHAEQSVALVPHRAVSLMRLERILIADPNRSAADLARAVDVAERADELTKHEAPRVLDSLAFAYAASGRLNEAAAVITDLLEIEIAAGGKRVDQLRARLELYERFSRSGADSAGSVLEPAIEAQPTYPDLEGFR